MMKPIQRKRILTLLAVLALSLSLFAFALPAGAAQPSHPQLPLSYDFEAETIADFTAVDNGAAPTRSTDARGGGGAMQMNRQGARLIISDAAWLVDGGFVNIEWYLKQVNADPASSWLKFQLWANVDDATQETVTLDKWSQPNSMDALLLSDEYQKCSGVFAFYSDGAKVYAYSKGTLSVLRPRANLVMNPQVILDFEIYSAEADKAQALMDDLSFTAATVRKDAVVTLVDEAEAPISGATFVIKDGAGAALAEQPEITEQNGVYTIHDLPYANMAGTYAVEAFVAGASVGKTSVGFLESEAVCTPPYTAQVVVRDEEGAALAGAKVMVAGQTVTTDAAGVAAIDSLYGVLEVRIVKDGLLPAFAQVSPSERTVSVRLAPALPAVIVEDNLLVGGDCEEDLPKPIGSDALTMQGAEYAVSDRERHSGVRSVQLKSTGGETSRLLMRYTYSVAKDGTGFAFEAYAKAKTAGAKLKIGFEAPCSLPDSQWAHLRGFSEEVALSTEEWTLVELSFAIRFDERTKETYYSLNGGEEALFAQENIIDVAALDLVFELSPGAEVYVDDLAFLQQFDATVTVKDAAGQFVADAAFELIDHRGERAPVAAVYDAATHQYTVAGLRGVISLIATAGEKVYEPCRLSKSVTSRSIEDAYRVTVTLKDEEGNAVTGATVIARQGVLSVGTFTESGGGVYVLEGVMGTVSVIVNVDGYTFRRTDGVTISNNALTIVGEKDDDGRGGENGDGDKGGCAGSAAATGGGTVLLLGLAAVILRRKVR